MDIITQRLIALGNKIIAELRFLRISVEKQTDAINSNEKSQQERAQAPPVIRADLHLPESDIQERHGDREHKKWVNRAQTLIQALTLLAVVYYAFYTRKQWGEMRKATIAATKAAATASQTMQLDERAWIHVSISQSKMTDGEPLTIPLTIVNGGKTNALNARGRVVVNVLSVPDKPDLTFKTGHPSYEIDVKTVPPNRPEVMNLAAVPKYLAPSAPWFVITVTPELRTRISRGQSYIVVHSRIEYDDIFNVHHWVQYCSSEFLGIPGVVRQNPAGQKCADYSDVDQNSPSD